MVGESGGARQLVQGAGVGSLTVTNPNNSFTGGVNISSAIGGNTGAPIATYTAANMGSLGVGPIRLTNGIFQLGSNFPVLNGLILNGGLVVLGGANPFVFNGGVSIAATTTVQAPAESRSTVSSRTRATSFSSSNLPFTAASTHTLRRGHQPR